MSVTCPHCENEHDEETFEGFCEACGEEFEAESSDDEEEEDPYKHIVVGVIVSSEPIPKKSKLSKLLIDVGGEDEIQVVSNAKYMDEGALVVVAKIGAKVDDIVIKKTAVGGVKSEGMICDGPMLGWQGTAGVAARVPASFSPGDTPPRTKPKV